MKNFFILLCLLSNLFVYAQDDYMYFLVEKMSLFPSKDDQYVLSGETLGKKIYVMMDNNEFEIKAPGKDPIFAKTYLSSERLYFVKDEIKFSMGLEKTNILYALTSLDAREAEIEIAKDGISITGEFLEAVMKDNSFLIRNISMVCPTNKFTTDVDIACLTQTKIIPFKEESGFVKLEDVSDQKLFSISAEADEIKIQDSSLSVSASKMWGEYKGSSFSFMDGNLICLKDPNLVDFDVQKFINGCLEAASLQSKNLSYDHAALDVKIDGALLSTDKGSLNIKANLVDFRTPEGVTTVRGFKYICDKLNVDLNNPNTYLLIDGCLLNSKLNIFQVDTDDKNLSDRTLVTDKGIFDINDFKHVELKVREGKFKFSAKVKMLARFKMLMSGKSHIDKENKQLVITVDKASVAGLPARAVALFFLKKFVDAQQVRIDRNKIYINL